MADRFDYDNLAKNLPDCYQKDKDSNNYKILEMERFACEELRDCLNDISKILDIENASGKTLDLYGERFGQARGKASDAQYRIMIKSKINRGLANGSYKSIVDAICYTFNCDKKDVLITETDKPMTVKLEKTPLGAIIKAGFSTSQAEQIIKRLLPVAVTMESILFEGTFEFSDSESEYNETAGFGETIDGAIGGYLGWTGSQESIDTLPI